VSSHPDSSHGPKAPVPSFGPTNPESPTDGIVRYASVIELLPEKEQLYRDLHADVWPEVVAAIKAASIQNYSIHVATIAGKRYLFSYFEYVGDDPEGDFGSIAADPVTKDKWWPLTDACQHVLEGTPESNQWLPMEQLMFIP